MSSYLAYYSGLFLVSLLFAALFAYLETVFTSLRLFEVNQLESRTKKFEKLFSLWRSKPQRILITILIASNFADVLCSVLVADIMQNLLGQQLGLALGVPLATLLILLFGNILPKSLARGGGGDISPGKLWFVGILITLFYPFVSFFLYISDLVSKVLGHSGNPEDVTEKEIEFLIDYSDEKGLMETDKSEMLQNVFGLGLTSVSSIMVSKSEMVILNVNTGLKEAYELFSSCRYSRIPVYEKREDNIVGFIYQKDLFSIMHKQSDPIGSLQELMRPVIFIPETKKTNELLREFLKNKKHMAIIIDEYGAVTGLVTLEDVLEEIVGEIRDEHEEADETMFVPLDNGEYLVNGKIELRRLESVLDIAFDAKESVTLGGFLSERLGHVPRKGERVLYGGYCFQVQQASLRKVHQVLLFQDDSSRS